MTTKKTMEKDEENLRKFSSAPVNPGTLTPSSISPSLIAIDDIPNNVMSMEQLKLLPSEFVSHEDPSRPLRHIDDDGQVLTYALRPMWYSVYFILLVELMERFCFYGINYTQTAYLTGVYDPDWNADLTAVEAASFVAICITIAYTSPFVGAALADSTSLGDYGTILLGCVGFYLPGLTVLCFTTIPSSNGEPFNTMALALGVLFLWPMGTGIVKSVVNVFGAKQFHPLVQSALIETYYVNFYMCINVGALLGGILIPIIAQFKITIAYAIPLLVLSLGTAIFLFGSTRYVQPKPRGDMFLNNKNNTEKKKLVKNNTSTNNDLSISAVAKVCLLLVPFNIAYSQMSTTFIIQGTVMNKAYGVLDAASMNNADTLSVLWFGYWIGSVLYPWLSKQQIKFQTTQKFALGSFMGVLALAWSLLVDYMIHQKYQNFLLLSSTNDTITNTSPDISPQISVLWQIPSYTLIGVGEIFAVSSAYEVAFMVAPPAKKALASAVNLFFIGGLPNIICLFLYQNCSAWFENANGRASIHTIGTYAEAHVYRYFALLLGIAMLGVIVNILPPVTNWVQNMEDKAANAIKTPKLSSAATLQQQQQQRRRWREEEERNNDNGESLSCNNNNSKENTPLLVIVKQQETKIEQYQNYLEYGTGPLLHKSGSMRAGPFLKKTNPTALKRQQQYTKLQYYQQKKRKNRQQEQQHILLAPPQTKSNKNNNNKTPLHRAREAPY